MIARGIAAAAIAAAAYGAAGLPSSPAMADGIEDFYRGRTMTILVGYGGRSTDSIYARAFSAHADRAGPLP